MSDPYDFRKLEFTSPTAVDRNWLDWFSEEFGREHFKFDMQPAPDTPFRLHGINRALPDFSVYHGQTSAVRSRSIDAREDDDPVITIGLAGAMSVHVDGQDIALQPGTAIALRNGVAGEFVAHASSEFVTIRLCRRLLEPLVPNLRDLQLLPIATDSQSMRLLLGYLRMLGAEEAVISPAAQHLAALHVHDLAALVFSNIQGEDGRPETGGVRAGRLAAVKADILRHLADPDLSAPAVAARLGVTPRYIHMLFETEDATFSEHVIGQRLTRAHRMLTDIRLATRTISSIAMDAGFGDLSYFNRTFRRRFGVTPSDVREAARNGPLR